MDDVINDFLSLYNGLFDKELPDLFVIPEQDKIEDLLNKVRIKEDFQLFKYSSDEFDTRITDFYSIKLHEEEYAGAENTLYYSYKNGGSLRQMGILNPFYYIAFIHNSILFKDSFFILKYLNFPYYNHSLSPIFANTDFYIIEDFYGRDEEEYVMNFLVNKCGFDFMQEKISNNESSFLFSLHVDISNFYQNIYTHHLERLGTKYDTFSSKTDNRIASYFKFLDRFNQNTNLSQTKGIIPGPFSSTLCAELFMCEIDKKILDYIANNHEKIGYVRNVDDFTFYSDSKEKLEEIFIKIQLLLSEYKLSINEEKTKILPCAFEYEESMLDDIETIVNSFLTAEQKVSTLENYKAAIGKAIREKKYSLAKAVLTKTNNEIIVRNYEFNDSKPLINFLLKLSLTEKYLGSRCFKMIDTLMSKNINLFNEQILEDFVQKNDLINDLYKDSIIQIWYYYLINKYGSDDIVSQCFDKYIKTEYTKNPLVLSTFVKKGDGKNKHIFDEIKKEVVSNGSLFYTKYVHTIMRIFANDKKNYENYQKSIPAIVKILFN